VLSDSVIRPIWDAAGRGLWTAEVRVVSEGSTILMSHASTPTTSEVAFRSDPIPGPVRVARLFLAPDDSFAAARLDDGRLVILDPGTATAAVLAAGPQPDGLLDDWRPAGWGPGFPDYPVAP